MLVVHITLSNVDTQFMEMSIENSVAKPVGASANKDAKMCVRNSEEHKFFVYTTQTRRLAPIHQEVAMAYTGALTRHANKTKSAIIPPGNFQRANVVKKLRFIVGFIHSKW